jgi:hypothetical protein
LPFPKDPEHPMMAHRRPHVIGLNMQTTCTLRAILLSRARDSASLDVDAGTRTRDQEGDQE